MSEPGHLKLTCPPRMAKFALHAFVESRKSWIEKQNENLRGQDEWRLRTGLEGEPYLYLGEIYRVKDGMTFLNQLVIEFDGASDNKTLWVHWPEKAYALKGTSQKRDQAWRSLQKKMRHEAERILTERLLYYAKEMDLKPRKLSFRSQKSRWGSCTSNGAISLNCKLIGAPLEVIDAVVVHELSHMVHMNHSKSFWSLVAKFAPEHKKADAWLGTNAHRLLSV